MKKIFIAALTAMAMCSFGYAQDDDEYEEEESTSQESEGEYEEASDEAAPAPKKEEKPAEPRKAVNAGAGTLGFQFDMISAFNGDPRFYVTYKIAPDMEASLILGLQMKGESSLELNGTSVNTDGSTNLDIGAGFDFFLTQKLLPISVGAELIYSSRGNLDNDLTTKDASIIEFNLMGGFRTEMTDHLFVTGKVGLNLDYYSWTTTITSGAISADWEGSRLDVGLKAQAFLTWFFI